MTYRSGVEDTAAAEQQLLRRLTQGDASAFWPLWERYRGEMLSRCDLGWMQGNRAEAEDVLSSSSIKAFQYLTNNPQDVRKFKPWLNGLLRNHCRDVWNARQRQTTYTNNTSRHRLTGSDMTLGTEESAEDALLRCELGTHIQYALASLPPQLREPALLRFVHEMAYHDIAAQLDLRPDNVRKRIQQARVLLQEQLIAYASDAFPGGSALTPSNALNAAWQGETGWVSRRPEDVYALATPCVSSAAFRLFLPNGIERHVYLMLDHKPRRQHQKVRTLRKYIHKHPEGWKKRRALAELLYAMGQWEEAITEYRHIVRKRPDCPDAWVRLGDILYMMHQHCDAMAAYKRAIALVGHEAVRQHLEGMMALCQQNPDRATQAFASASTLTPQHRAHAHMLALTHAHTARPIEALQVFDEVLKHDPDDLFALTHSHQPLHTAGRYAEAQRRAAHAVACDPDHALALARLANYTSSTQAPGIAQRHARQHIQRALSIAPHSPEAHEALARSYIFQGEWVQGLKMLERFVTQHPRSPAGRQCFAQWQARCGDIARAAHEILQAHNLEPHDADILQTASQILLAAGNLPALQKIVDSMLQQFPTHWNTWTTAGYVWLKGHGDGRHACELSAHGPTRQPRLAQAWLQHGNLLFLAGRYHEAATVLETGWTWLPESDGFEQAIPAAVRLCESYAALDNMPDAHMWAAQAMRCVRKFTTVNPALAYYWRGKVLAALGREALARQALCTSLQHHVFYPVRQEAKEKTA